VSSQPSGPAATYAGIFLPETATAKQGAKARRGFGVARETVADDKKGASEIKLAWCLSTNRARVRRWKDHLSNPQHSQQKERRGNAANRIDRRRTNLESAPFDRRLGVAIAFAPIEGWANF